MLEIVKDAGSGDDLATEIIRLQVDDATWIHIVRCTGHLRLCDSRIVNSVIFVCILPIGAGEAVIAGQRFRLGLDQCSALIDLCCQRKGER